MSISISEHSITEFVRWADYLGTFAFAISGTRLAAAHRFDWFGAFVIGLVTAVGGGTIRDVMLDLPVFWMIEPSYILIATLALFVTIVLRHWLVRINNTVFIFDAIGLGLFTAVGVAKSLHAGLPGLVCPCCPSGNSPHRNDLANPCSALPLEYPRAKTPSRRPNI